LLSRWIDCRVEPVTWRKPDRKKIQKQCLLFYEQINDKISHRHFNNNSYLITLTNHRLSTSDTDRNSICISDGAIVCVTYSDIEGVFLFYSVALSKKRTALALLLIFLSNYLIPSINIAVSDNKSRTWKHFFDMVHNSGRIAENTVPLFNSLLCFIFVYSTFTVLCFNS